MSSQRFAPGHDRAGGELRIGGARSSELTAAYGTPLLVIDYGVLDAAVETFTAACGRSKIEIAYAGKALLLVALAKHLKHTVLNLDVCSLGELATAERAAFPSERITFHGCGKTDEELDAAVEGRVGRVVVDNLDELRRLGVRSAKQAVPVMLRINTGIEAHTHDFVRTSGDRTKFGFDPDAAAAAIEILKTFPRLRFLGLHSHIGSQIFESEAFAANASAIMERAAYFAQAGFESEQIIVGGGFGVRMFADDPNHLDVAQTVGAIAASVRKAAQRWNIREPRIGIEPGRALTAQAGTTLYSVMAAKREFGRPYAIVDGGVFENPRPALYGAHHHTLIASREGGPLVETVLCGRSCENDELGTASLPEDLRAGDVIAMCTTGAYTYSMAGNYNRFARPAVVAVRGGSHSLIARRETIDEILRKDVDG